MELAKQLTEKFDVSLSVEDAITDLIEEADYIEDMAREYQEKGDIDMFDKMLLIADNIRDSVMTIQRSVEKSA